LFRFLDLLALLLFRLAQSIYFRAHLAFSFSAGARFVFCLGADHFQSGKMMLLLFGLKPSFFFEVLSLFFSATPSLFKALSLFFGAPAGFLFSLQTRFLFGAQPLLLREPLGFLLSSLASGLGFRAMTFEFQRGLPERLFFAL